MNVTTLLLFAAGVVLLIVGAETLVRGASRLAAAAGISPLVIGLTVVAYGTSSPEMAVSVKSALAGQVDIALGNVVGSNIFNVLFILGVSALVAPLVVQAQLVRLDVPLMIGVSAVLFVLGLDGAINRPDGALLCAGFIGYTVFAIVQSRRESREIQDEYAQEFAARPGETRRWPIDGALIVVGLGLLVLGSRWLVDGAVVMARALRVSELIIGLTIVAAGTSLPEVATSLIAAVRGERDIAVGNVVGSNLFNILAVLGTSALAAPQALTVSAAALRFDIPVMLAVAVASLPIFFTGHLIARWEGALFLSYYAAYVLYLILDAVGHDALPAFSGVMLVFVLPLTVLTLAIGVARSLGRRRPAS
ncbi:MAG: calcium/sodium antiporter [Armatimonadota bacterium]|nr:calcium/sodium antiporter [Armatimonadota bacterium]